MLNDQKKGDLKYYQNYLKTSRLSFASMQELIDHLHVTTGSVTPFGLIYNDGTISVLIDKELVDQNLLLHPLTNTVTICISFDDLLCFLKYVKNPYFFV